MLKQKHIALLAFLASSLQYATAFQPQCPSTKPIATQLFMGKGLNKAKNKQMDLKRKMELAKQQRKEASGEDGQDDGSSKKALSDKEIKEQNDRKRFEELLSKEGASVMNDYTSDAYLNIKQEEEEIKAARSGVDRLFEGDPAPTDCFESLVSVTTEKVLAKKGAQRLVPWLTAGIHEDDYRVIVCDPRQSSDELHQTIKDLYGGLPKDIKERLYFINADTPSENRRWMKKNNAENVNIYCDTEKEWMRAYTALGETRWSMTMFIICQGRVNKIARDLDVYNSCRTVINAVKAMKNEMA